MLLTILLILLIVLAFLGIDIFLFLPFLRKSKRIVQFYGVVSAFFQKIRRKLRQAFKKK
ncbi:MAG: hypothetical protein J5873_00935 [Bacteroidales bacterium]|nr:hypothetical protein [Bacteroidales bacterium]